MKDYTKWTRVNLEAPGEPSMNVDDPIRRKECERQTNNDLRKPIQQLICDVHEEANTPGVSEEQKLTHSVKRMVSMMGRVALEHEEVGKDLVKLTWWLIVLTVFIIFLTVAVIFVGILPLVLHKS